MRIFISWSGETSREVALALRDWLPLVVNDIVPFVSAEDIFAGARWQAEIARELEVTDFGLVCVTRDNQDSPWINFEAGALAKAVSASRVIPLTIDLSPSEVTVPLGQFQSQPLNQAGLHAVLKSLNRATKLPIEETRLGRAVAKWWPDLEVALKQILLQKPAHPALSARTDRELLEETLNAVRSLARADVADEIGQVATRVSVDEVQRLWPEILQQVKQLRRFTWILLSQNAQVSAVNGQTIRLRMSNEGSVATFARGASEDVLREALSAVMGREFQIEVGLE